MLRQRIRTLRKVNKGLLVPDYYGPSVASGRCALSTTIRRCDESSKTSELEVFPSELEKQQNEYKEFLEFKKWKESDGYTGCVTESSKRPKRIVVAITGATGVVLGVKILEMLKKLGVETHVIISRWGIGTMKFETDYTLEDITRLSSVHYSFKDVSAPISSGSFQHDGMIVVPCSMKTLSAIRTGYTEDLIVRAADVTIKEQRKLLLCVRETPLSSIHLENMLSLSNKDVIIFPPVPAFYTKPKTIDHIVQQTSGRILDCFGLDTSEFPRWNGMKNANVVEE